LFFRNKIKSDICGRRSRHSLSRRISKRIRNRIGSGNMGERRGMDWKEIIP